ncbi:thioredoxin-like protein, partial [Phakopsora pachyrhizi]
IKKNHILIYSKSYCPHSLRAKKLLESIHRKISEPKVFELNLMGSEGEDIQAYLLERTKQRTVPNIFIAQAHIGGADDLVNLHNAGALEPMIVSRSRIYSKINKFKKIQENTDSSFLIFLLIVIVSAIGYTIFRRSKSQQQLNLKEKM